MYIEMLRAVLNIILGQKIDVEKLERVQKRATKLIPETSKKPYRERLQVLNFPTLKYRRYRGDMIEVFKTIKGIYDPTCVPHLDLVKFSDDVIRDVCKSRCQVASKFQVLIGKSQVSRES